ncbi:MAG: hypothetical protein ABI573_10835 [Chloroflexota bacterium]
MSQPHASHERIYRGLLRLYPAEFQARFGDEMVQLFGDQLRDARTGRAASALAGPAQIWLRTLSDLAITVTSEHLRRDRTMAHSLSEPPSIPMRALGVIGILGGVALVLAFIPNLPWIWDFVAVRLVLVNVGTIAIGVAVYRAGALGTGRVAVAVAGAVILANAWYLVMVIAGIGRPQFPEADPDFRLIFFYAGAAMWLTDAVFGFAIWRLGAVARWGGLALAVGSLFAITGMDRLELVRGDLAWIWTPAALIGIALNGLAWIALGIAVATRRRSAVASNDLVPDSSEH